MSNDSKPIVRIQSGSTSRGTKVFDTASGQEIKGITRLTWTANVDDANRVQAEIVCAGADVEGELTVVAQAPDMDEPKPVKRIEFEDGTVWPSEF